MVIVGAFGSVSVILSLLSVLFSAQSAVAKTLEIRKEVPKSLLCPPPLDDSKSSFHCMLLTFCRFNISLMKNEIVA